MLRTLKREGNGYCVEKAKKTEQPSSDSSLEVTGYLQEVINQNAVVFTSPVELPPLRGHEHSINLKGRIQNNLVVNKKKCAFGKVDVAYLGHVVLGQGVAVDMEKIQAVMGWKQPTNLKEL
ncbi:hypothetical protein AgCh_007786 [Apium graveolens]